MWSPQTKFTSPHLAIITMPSPQDWCLAPMITGWSFGGVPRTSTRMPQTTRIRITVARQ